MNYRDDSDVPLITDWEQLRGKTIKSVALWNESSEEKIGVAFVDGSFAVVGCGLVGYDGETEMRLRATVDIQAAERFGFIDLRCKCGCPMYQHAECGLGACSYMCDRDCEKYERNP